MAKHAWQKSALWLLLSLLASQEVSAEETKHSLVVAVEADRCHDQDDMALTSLAEFEAPSDDHIYLLVIEALRSADAAHRVDPNGLPRGALLLRQGAEDGLLHADLDALKECVSRVTAALRSQSCRAAKTSRSALAY